MVVCDRKGENGWHWIGTTIGWAVSSERRRDADLAHGFPKAIPYLTVSLDHHPPSIKHGVQNCAAAWHVSHDEAVIKLLETGLAVLQPQLIEDDQASPKDFRQAKEAARQAKLKALAETLPERASAVFRAFADVPGFRESIDAVIARRAERYGFPE